MFTIRQHPQFFSLFRGKVEWVCIANTEVGGEGECKWEKGEEHWAAERDGNKLVSVVASSLQPPIAALPSSRPTGSLVTLDRDQPVFLRHLAAKYQKCKNCHKKGLTVKLYVILFYIFAFTIEKFSQSNILFSSDWTTTSVCMHSDLQAPYTQTSCSDPIQLMRA